MMVKPKNLKSFDDLVELHPTVHKLKRGASRDERIKNLKTKVLQTLKVKERRHRELSGESVKSNCSTRDRAGSTDSRGSVRARFGSEEDLPDPTKAQHQSRSRIKLPKILLTQQ